MKKFIIAFIILTALFSCKIKPPQLVRIEGKQTAINETIASDKTIENTIKPYREKVEKEMNTYDSFAIIALDSINRINEVNLIEIQLNSEFKSTDNSKILVSIDNRSTGENLFWNNRSVLQFQEKGINRTHTGTYFFKFDPITETENIELSLLLETQSDNRILRNVVVKFYKII